MEHDCSHLHAFFACFTSLRKKNICNCENLDLNKFIEFWNESSSITKNNMDTCTAFLRYIACNTYILKDYVDAIKLREEPDVQFMVASPEDRLGLGVNQNYQWIIWIPGELNELLINDQRRNNFVRLFLKPEVSGSKNSEDFIAASLDFLDLKHWDHFSYTSYKRCKKN